MLLKEHIEKNSWSRHCPSTARIKDKLKFKLLKAYDIYIYIYIDGGVHFGLDMSARIWS